ncbi:MAG: preprotein translocase subunit SecE, partial [Planctomycetia bacterium]
LGAAGGGWVGMALMTSTTTDLFRAMLSSQAYKPGQGNMARYGTLSAVALIVLSGAYLWSQSQIDGSIVTEVVAPLAICGVLLWATYRLIHYPRLADFLISTEAEMVKVSWPSWGETKASTVVVIINVVILATFLFVVDLFWKWLLSSIGILQIRGLLGGSQGMFHVPPLPMMSDFVSLLS